jgi:hypothetical protein
VIASSMSRWVAETMRVSTAISPRPPTRCTDPLFEHAQQLYLHVGRHVADLVEEERAAMGVLEAAALLVDGAGERALFMAEQLGFEQIARDRAAIDGDIGAAPRGRFRREWRAPPSPCRSRTGR